MVGFLLGLGLSQSGGGRAVPVPGALATAFAIAPTVHYHAPSASITNYSGAPASVGERVKTVVDHRGLANIEGPGSSGSVPGTSASAPILAQDALGRKYLNFRSGAWASIADTLTGLDGRGCTIIALYRCHKGGTYNIFYPRFAAVNTVNTNRTGALALLSPDTSARHSYPIMGQNGSTMGAAADTANKKWHRAGSQMQVLGVRSNATNALYRTNGKTATSTAVASLGTGRFGAILGGAPHLTNGATVDTARGMSLYELVVYNSVLSDAQFNAAVDAMQANWAVADFTQIVGVEGDSISEGIGHPLPSTNPVKSDQNVAMLMSAPGQPFANKCVVNIARGGSTIGVVASDNGNNNCVYRRDITDSFYAQTLPGGAANNIVVIQAGANDFVSNSGASCYGWLRDLIFTTTNGYLQRGWKVNAVVNIARGSTTQAFTACTDQRALMVSSLLADCQAGPGQTYDGQVRLIRADLIEVGAATRFLTLANTADTIYYQEDDTAYPTSDKVHPSAIGTDAMYSGGGTPQHGYGAAA